MKPRQQFAYRLLDQADPWLVQETVNRIASRLTSGSPG